MQLREAGNVPANGVYVVFAWNVGRIFPRVVLDGATPVDELDLRFLAGLHVVVAYGAKDSPRVIGVAQAIMKVKPKSLRAFAIDIPQNFVIKPIGEAAS
jgi:hypothetical protein